MLSRGRTQRVVACLALALACGCPIAVAEAGDPARLLPADTLVYVGWSNVMSADERAYCHDVMQALEKQAQTIEGAQPLMEHLMPMVSTLLRAPGCIGIMDVTLSEAGPNLEAALVIDAGADADALLAQINAIIGIAAASITVESTTVDGTSFRRFRPPDAPFSILWGVYKDRLIVSLGETAAHEVMRCLDGESGALAESASLQRSRERGRWARESLICEAFVDTPAIMVRIKQLMTADPGAAANLPMIETLHTALGLNGIQALHGMARRDGELIVLTGFCHVEGPRTGLLRLWEQEALSDADIAVIARDPCWAMTWNLDLKPLFFDGLKTVRQIDQQAMGQVQMGVGAAAGAMGFRSLDELWAIFGDTWTIYDASDHGGLILTGAVLVAEVKDRAGMDALLERLQTTINTFTGGMNIVLTRKQTQHGEHTIDYLLVGGLPVPVAPAWGFAGDRWVFGLYPQVVAVALAQADTKTRTSSLLDNPEYQLARRQSPETVQGLCYVDTRMLARVLYPIQLAIETAAASKLANSGLGLDLSTHPTYQGALTRVHNIVATSSRLEDGLLWTCTGSGGQARIDISLAALALAEGMPKFAQMQADNRMDVRANHIRSLAITCIQYGVDHEAWHPASLEELVEKGMLNPDDLRPAFRDGKTGAYVYIGPQNQTQHPGNVLMYERPWSSKGTHVAFTDGSVKWLTERELKEALTATYTKLGRADEAPMEAAP